MKKLLAGLLGCFLATSAFAQSCPSAVCVLTNSSLGNGLAISGVHNLIGAHATGAIPANGMLLIIDGTAVPADGAVVPAGCFTMQSTISPNTTSTIAMANPIGVPTVNGIVLVVSSSGTCFTLTKVTNLYFSALYQ